MAERGLPRLDSGIGNAGEETIIAKEVHYHVYYDQVIQGNVVGTKAEIKDSVIESVGGRAQSPRVEVEVPLNRVDGDATAFNTQSGVDETIREEDAETLQAPPPTETSRRESHGHSPAASHQSSLLELIRIYKNEDSTISKGIREKYKDIFPLIGRVWTSIKTKAIAESCERQLADSEEGTTDPMLPEYQELARNFLVELNITSYMTPYKESVPIIIELAKELQRQKHFFCATVLHYAAGKLYHLSNFGEASVRSISHCVYEMKLLADDIVRDVARRPVGLHHVIPLMRELMADLKSYRKSSQRSEFEAWCLCNIALCHGACGDNATFALMNDQAVELLETEFKEDAYKYAAYKHCLKNAAVAYERMGDFATSYKRHDKERQTKDPVYI